MHRYWYLFFWSGFRKEILFSCMSSFAPINDDLFEITSTRRVWLFLKWREKNGCCGQNSIIRGWCYHIKNRWFDTMDRRTCFHSKRLTYSCFWFWQCIFSVDKSLSFFFLFSIIDSVCVSFLVVKKNHVIFQYSNNTNTEWMRAVNLWSIDRRKIEVVNAEVKDLLGR